MKLVVQGDLHIRDNAPVNRTDNYDEAQFSKLQCLVDFANEHDAFLCLAGDIFDTYKVSPETVNRTAVTLSGVDKGIFAVLGQHDIPYHQTDIMKSPVFSLANAKMNFHLPTPGYIMHTRMGDEKLLAVHGCSWGYKPSKPMKNCYNVLLGHISVFEKEVPWYWKGEGYGPKDLRKQYPGFDLYLCGDIHDPVVDDNVVVSGSMTRLNISQKDYQPRCYLIDTLIGEIKPLFYPIEHGVFNISEKISPTLDLTNLVGALKNTDRLRNSFRKDCDELTKDKPAHKAILEEIFHGIDNRNK